jgi:Tol biopolymer transport system component
VLVYQGVGQPTRQMVWLDRAGRQIVTAGEPGEYGPPRVSPDGNRAVVAKVGKDQRSAHLWLLDRNGAAEQISSGGIHEGSPVWAPDGTRIAYFAAQGAAYDIYVRTVARESKGELLLKSDTNKFPTDWSRDGRYLIFGQQGEGTRLDVFGFGTGDHRAAPVLNTVYAEGFGAVSPNGKWLAYQSDQSGRNEVYIQSFDGLSNGTKRRWQVSKGGGLPRWRSDSNELFYITQDGRLMSVPVHDAAEGGIEAGQPQLLFQTRPVPKTWNLFDVSPDGQRFLFNMPLEWTSANPITVVTNWTEKLREQ